MKTKLAAGIGVVGLWALGCSDNTGPAGVPTQDLTFVEQASAAPALQTYRVQFYAIAGQQQRVEILYANGEDFLQFDLDEETLVRDSAGRLLAPGDSVRITITVDTEKFIVRFQPEGLVFNQNRPAELEFEYARADSLYLDQETLIGAWRQERVGEPWQELAPLRFDVTLDEIEIEVPGFTRYALAVN